ncbi:hypothetical protein GQ43DRAFT_375743, partial [Delitschia confertaspora ATCC 74209]
FPPPWFLLQLFLLTEDQLDRMAHYYHQSTPNHYTYKYPVTMGWDPDFLEKPKSREEGGEGEFRLNDLERLQIKMRKFAKFIGMRGAETPMWEAERQIQVLVCRVKSVTQEEEEMRERKHFGMSRICK